VNDVNGSEPVLEWSETFTCDNVNRLSTSEVTGESTVTMTYSAAGRVLTKTGCAGGTWTYGAGAAGPFAVTSACGNSYAYDANGRMTSRAGSSITWTSFDKPKQINSGAQSTEIVFKGKKLVTFDDGPDRASITELDHKGGVLPSKKLVILLFGLSYVDDECELQIRHMEIGYDLRRDETDVYDWCKMP
jgi:YD repeat-containing protein